MHLLLMPLIDENVPPIDSDLLPPLMSLSSASSLSKFKLCSTLLPTRRPGSRNLQTLSLSLPSFGILNFCYPQKKIKMNCSDRKHCVENHKVDSTRDEEGEIFPLDDWHYPRSAGAHLSAAKRCRCTIVSNLMSSRSPPLREFTR